MLPIRNTSYLLPMCCSFWEKCINSQKTGQRCSTPLNSILSNFFCEFLSITSALFLCLLFKFHLLLILCKKNSFFYISPSPILFSYLFFSFPPEHSSSAFITLSLRLVGERKVDTSSPLLTSNTLLQSWTWCIIFNIIKARKIYWKDVP